MTGDLFRQYMFSRTNDAQHEELRERLLADHDLSDQLRDQENDWIDAYAAGTLPAADAALLHNHLANTGQLGRIPTAKALLRKPAQSTSVFPYSLALAAAIFLCFTVAFQSGKRPVVAPPPPDLPLVSLALPPGTLRSGQAIPTLTAAPGQSALLQLLYQDTAPTGMCRVLLSHVGSPLTLNTVDTECGLDFHAYTLPPELSPGRYAITLANASGEPIHTYVFVFAR